MNKVSQIVGSHKQSVRIILTFLVFTMVGTLLFVLALRFWVEPEIDEELRESASKEMDHIVLVINEHLERAGTTAQALANAAKLMPAVSTEQSRIIKPIIKSIMETPGSEYLIAGGGIWPEPFQFNIEKERDSYFWGRDKNNQLIFYDDYNLVDGPGYHHQEWYVPARYKEPGEVYWSKSYTDPYSMQSMVTATAPIINDGKFIGVSTVDVKLEGLSELLKAIKDRYRSHVFFVDRNLQLIAMPAADSLENEMPVTDGFFHNVEFRQVSAVLETHRKQRIDAVKQQPEIRRLAREMSNNSGEITFEEGLLIASGLQVKKSRVSSLHLLEPLLIDAEASGPILVFSQLIPSLQWTIVISVDRSDIFSVSTFFSNLNQLQISIVLIFIAFIYWHINRYILKPLSIIDDHLVVEYKSLDGEFSKYLAEDSVVAENNDPEQKDVIARISEELLRRDQYLKHAMELLNDNYHDKVAKDGPAQASALGMEEYGHSCLCFSEFEHGQDMSVVRSQLRGRKVLLVEDDIVSRKLLHEVCDSYGLISVGVGSGGEMWEQLEAHNFDAVLLDLNLPDTDGWTLRESIRTQADLKRLPIIIISASNLDSKTIPFTGDTFCGCFNKGQPFEQLFFWLATWFPEPLGTDKKDNLVEAEILQHSNIPLTKQQSLNGTRGIAYCHGDREIFQLLLATFREQFEYFGDLSKVSLSTGQKDQLIKQVHNLETSAIIIGAEKLALKTQELANFCRQDQISVTVLEAGLRVVEKELQAVLAAINSEVRVEN
ncbi:MAG TPA: response regulator [Methylococcaceae bacterium]|nr:response regulator [Methylococcaceae bacterium]